MHMTMTHDRPLLLDGRLVARERLSYIKNATRAFIDTPPKLAIITVGTNDASHLYVQRKITTARSVGFETVHIALEHTTQKELHTLLDTLSHDNSIHAILLQLPLPKNLSAIDALCHINPDKDADALHPLNMGRLLLGTPIITPCTPQGILTLMAYYKIAIARKNIVILGSSLIVGTPLSIVLTQARGTVTLCHTFSPDPSSIISTADIVITATGCLDVFPLDILKKDSVLIDVGIIRTPEGIRGDVMQGSALSNNAPSHIYAYTPVPYGIGPMTVVSLMENVLTLYKRSLHSN